MLGKKQIRLVVENMMAIATSLILIATLFEVAGRVGY